MHTPLSRNYSAAPQMREIGLRAIAALCEQAYDPPQGGINAADVVLLNSYENNRRQKDNHAALTF